MMVMSCAVVLLSVFATRRGTKLEVQESSITSDMTTLMLAWQLARVDGLSQAAAIRKCARKLRDTTKDVKMFNLMTSINKCSDDSRVVDCLDKLADKLKQDGLMFN